jgi:mannose-6-phosphate isomerase-like protein (cupin superfamily)
LIAAARATRFRATGISRVLRRPVWLVLRRWISIQPDETRTPDKTRVDVIRVGDTTAARMTFEPGWRWSECVKPVVGTDRCQVRHVGVVQSGRLHVVHEDGTEVEIGPGDAYVIEPGHDGWVVGDESFVGFEFEAPSAEEFARS